VDDEDWEGKCRKVYSCPDILNKNSLSLVRDQENFICSDDIHVNLYNLDNSVVGYNLIDIEKPD
jgi:hypothetical protein